MQNMLQSHIATQLALSESLTYWDSTMCLTEASLCLQGPAWTMAKTASRLCKAAMLKQLQQLEAALSSTNDIRQNQVSCKAAMLKEVEQLEVAVSSTSDIRGKKLPSHVQEAAAGQLQKHTGTTCQLGNTDDNCDRSYRAHKNRGGSAAYMRQWCTLQSCDVFLQWIKKPQHLEHFTLPTHDIASTT